MRFFNYYRVRSRARSAGMARQRLQSLVAQERIQQGGHQYLPLLRHEVLQAVRKFMEVDPDAVHISLESQAGDSGQETLQIRITLPEGGAPAAGLAPQHVAGNENQDGTDAAAANCETDAAAAP